MEKGIEMKLQPEGAEKPEILVSHEELKFLAEFGRDEGRTRARIVIDHLNFPRTNIVWGSEREQGEYLAWVQRIEARPEVVHKMGPEAGGFEYNTADFIGQAWESSLSGLEEDGGKGQIAVCVIDGGVKRFLGLAEYQMRLLEGTENLLIAGVVFEMQGDDPDGATILVRSDMDALTMADGSVDHRCGHSIHTGWAAANAHAMVKFRKQFGGLPLKKLIFVSEANEEANASAGDLVSPREMSEAGFEARFGKADLAVAQHVIGHIPEGHMRVEDFNGATDFVATVTPNENYQPGVDADIGQIPALLANKISLRYNADSPRQGFGKVELVRDTGEKSPVPALYVRLAASVEADEGGKFPGMAVNSLPANVQYQGVYEDSSPVMAKSRLTDAVQEICKEWSEAGFPIEAIVTVDEDDRTFKVELSRPASAHVAFGGPNLQQLMGHILSHIRFSSGPIASIGVPRAVKFGGTVRMKVPDYEAKTQAILKTIGENILPYLVEQLGLNGKVKVEFASQNAVAPTLNDSHLKAQAEALYAVAGLPPTDVTMACAAVESFAEWRHLVKDPSQMLYVLVGGLKAEIADKLLKDGGPIPARAMHHSAEFAVEERTVSDGVVMSALILQLARDWKKRQQKT